MEEDNDIINPKLNEVTEWTENMEKQIELDEINLHKEEEEQSTLNNKSELMYFARMNEYNLDKDMNFHLGVVLNFIKDNIPSFSEDVRMSYDILLSSLPSKNS
jgi:hypothetical protein